MNSAITTVHVALTGARIKPRAAGFNIYSYSSSITFIMRICTHAKPHAVFITTDRSNPTETPNDLAPKVTSLSLCFSLNTCSRLNPHGDNQNTCATILLHTITHTTCTTAIPSIALQVGHGHTVGPGVHRIHFYMPPLSLLSLRCVRSLCILYHSKFTNFVVYRTNEESKKNKKSQKAIDFGVCNRRDISSNHTNTLTKFEAYVWRSIS